MEKRQILLSFKEKSKPIAPLKTGNGRHRANARFLGVLQKNEDGSYVMLLPGEEVPCYPSRQMRNYIDRDEVSVQGVKAYIGYPRTGANGKLKKIVLNSIQHLSRDDKTFIEEEWIFIGEWEKKHNRLLVQRDLARVKTPDRLHHYEYALSIAPRLADSLKNKHCYQLICRREGLTIVVVDAIHLACPINKPTFTKIKSKYVNANTKNIQLQGRRSLGVKKIVVR